MALSSRQRWLVIGSALALTLGGVAWVGMESEESAEVAQPARPGASADKNANRAASTKRANPSSDLGLERPKSQGESEIRDIFAQQSWYTPPPAPAAPVAAAPAAPAVPSLPFTYLGKMEEDGRVTVYLSAQDRNLAVKKGDVIDGTWRVEKIGQHGVVFKYLPMGKKQSLEMGR